MDAMETATLKLDGCALEVTPEAPSQQRIFAQKSVEMASIGAGIHAMTETFKMAMAVPLTAFKNLDSDVQGEMSRHLTFVQSYVEMGSMRGFWSVMTRIYKMETVVMRIVLLSLDGVVLVGLQLEKIHVSKYAVTDMILVNTVAMTETSTTGTAATNTASLKPATIAMTGSPSIATPATGLSS